MAEKVGHHSSGGGELVEGSRTGGPGDLEALVAQARRGNGLLRVPFLEGEGERKILTVYWTSKVEKYWREEQDANPV